ncbi:ATP-binding SpoIIE family protein phosphatase [Streptomyces aidingensis]|uniref:Serine phosphatase RsbU, regulator of sigma subunit n=1 Tax=Streptomyces aidingensis TaxID=910347 RepID=A0A1I1TX05_9ACTN|nr:ATP-binding SpoIIE family protein phosphatase [Streptomyces aidingensis]SFD63092.1 Serine phosphatase RsbU, regulator of sigma subunit [Streptomyces aidingensis]
MNLTRWSLRLPGTQRRNAAAPAGGTTGVRTGSAGQEHPSPADQPRDESPPDPGPALGSAAGPDQPRGRDAERRPAAVAHGIAHGIDARAVHELLGQVPAPVALVHGPDHRVAYVNNAYSAVFGARTPGTPARQGLTELTELGLLPLMDQVRRSGTPRTLKSRRVAGRSRDSFYTFTCTPVRLTGLPATETPSGGVLIFASDVTDQVVSAERLRESESRQRAAAVTLQRSLLPQKQEQPDDLRVAATYRPGGTDAAIGGDWYDVIPLGAGRTALVIGDVMGRGMRAAAVMGQLRTAVRAYARLDLPPHEVIQLLDGLAAEIDPSQIATCLYAVHDPNEDHLVFASAGHLPVFVRRPDGTVHRADEPTGPPLGTGGWTHTSGSTPFPPGALAVLCTDGLVERRDADIDEGLAALEEALAGSPRATHTTPQIVCDRLLRSLGIGEGHDDDVAILVMARPERDTDVAGLFRGAALDLLGGIEATPRARAFADGVLASWRFPEELRELGVLATSELVANSLQHGKAPMRLRLRRTDRRLIVEVTDGDENLPRRRHPAPADEAGRGISIVAAIATDWGTRLLPDGGKSVWAEFTLPSQRATGA